MQRAIEICEAKGLTCEDRGALLVDLTKYKRVSAKCDDSERDWAVAGNSLLAPR
jgi:arginyl-tRNA synthetase